MSDLGWLYTDSKDGKYQAEKKNPESQIFLDIPEYIYKRELQKQFQAYRISYFGITRDSHF